MGHRTPVKMLTGAPLLLAISFGIGDAVGGPGEYITTAPPAPRPEAMPDSPGRDYTWVGGHWVWSGREYAWAAGRWERWPKPRARWVSGHWKQADRGWTWVEGHWR